MNRIRIAMISLLLLTDIALARAEEPIVRLPESAVVFPAGNRVTWNGVPFKMIGFSSTASLVELLSWFTKNLGAPIKADTIGKSLVLGKLIQGHYITVRLEPARMQVQGVVAISDLKVSREQLSAYKADLGHWLSEWPNGSRVLSDMTSEDQGKSSRHVLISNSQSETINSNRVTAILKRNGYHLEREVVTDATTAGTSRVPSVDGRTLYFRGEGKEAMATITRDKQGNTVTVLNTISSLENFQ